MGYVGCDIYMSNNWIEIVNSSLRCPVLMLNNKKYKKF